VHVAAVCTINLLLLSVVMFLPANDTYRIDRWVWERGQKGAVVLYTLDEWPKHFTGSTSDTFYRSHNLVLSPVESADQLRAARRDAPVYVYYRGYDPPELIARLGVCTPLLRSYPVWLGRLASFVKSTNVHLATICRMDATR